MNFTAKFKTGNLTDKDVSDMISDIRKNYDMNHLTTAHLTNYFGLKTQQICKFVQYHPEIEIERRPAGSKRNPHFELVWSESSVRDFIFTYLREKFPAADPITSPLSSAYQIANQQIAAPDSYTSPIDILIALDNSIKEDPNTEAYYNLKNRFEHMNERSLQILFAPILERFKFRYIISQIPELQSQTLTCILRGGLKGMQEYALTFGAFLKLIKFAHDNYVPLNSDFQTVSSKSQNGEV